MSGGRSETRKSEAPARLYVFSIVHILYVKMVDFLLFKKKRVFNNNHFMKRAFRIKFIYKTEKKNGKKTVKAKERKEISHELDKCTFEYVSRLYVYKVYYFTVATRGGGEREDGMARGRQELEFHSVILRIVY